jgi:hypothetical protein
MMPDKDKTPKFTYTAEDMLGLTYIPPGAPEQDDEKPKEDDQKPKEDEGESDK